MKVLPWILLICVTTLAAHSYIGSQSRIQVLETSLNLSEQARDIESDQVRDLMFALRSEQIKEEAIATQSFVAGVVDSINRKDHYEKIWHDGYDRGSEVQLLVNESSEKSKFLPKK